MESITSSIPIVSVVLPVYNGEKYVRRAIKSVLRQTIDDWELIILDDGSTDGSLAICQEYAKQDDRIKVYRNKRNLGLSKTMNLLVYLAEGKYIAIQEQDDASLSYRLEREVNFLEEHPQVGLVSGVAAYLNEDQKIYRYFGNISLHEGYCNNKYDIIKYLYVHGCVIRNAACMFRRSILEKLPIPFDDQALIPDYQFILHVAHFYKIQSIPYVLILLQRGQSHASFSANHELCFSEGVRCLTKVYREYRHNSRSPITYALFRKALSNRYTHYSLSLERRNKLFKIIWSIYYNPLNYKAWKMFIYFIINAVKNKVSCLS